MIAFSCPGCQASYQVPDEHAGKSTKCRTCGTRIVVPGRAAQPVAAVPQPVVLQASSASEPLKSCPFCGEPVLAAAKKCKHCGETIDVALRAAEEARRTAERSSPHAPMVFMNAGGGASSSASAASSSGTWTDSLPEASKSRIVAAILAILLGGLGAHKFYLGKAFQGLLYLVFCWTFIPSILGLIEGISYLGMSERKFAQKYG